MISVKTYLVQVYGYDGALYCARSASKARAAAFRAFREARPCEFRDFVDMARVLRVENPPGVGERIMVHGKPAKRVLPLNDRVGFMHDDSDVRLWAHPSDVQPIPTTSPNPGAGR